MAFKYLRLAAELQAAISEGTFADKLPTEQTLCDAYQGQPPDRAAGAGTSGGAGAC